MSGPRRPKPEGPPLTLIDLSRGRIYPANEPPPPRLAYSAQYRARVVLYTLLAAFVLLLLSLSSCAPRWRYVERPVRVVDSVYVERVETLRVHVPAAIVRDTIEVCDTIVWPIDRYVVRVDSSGRAQLRYWRDAYNRLHIECRAAEAAATATSGSRQTVRISREELPRPPEAPPSGDTRGFFKGMPWWLWIIICVMGLVAIQGFIEYFLRRR